MEKGKAFLCGRKVEKRKSFHDSIHEDFQRRYASNVLELSQVNRDLNEHLKSIQEFTQEFAPEVGSRVRKTEDHLARFHQLRSTSYSGPKYHGGNLRSDRPCKEAQGNHS